MASLKATFPDARLYDPATLHVTAAFLGDLAEAALPALFSAAAAAERESPSPDTAELSGVGGFPSWARPRVLWAGVGAGSRAMEALAASLRRGLEAEGFALEERPFRPHCTLGRLKGAGACSAPPPSLAPSPFLCGPVRLYESRLGSSGAVHTELRP